MEKFSALASGKSWMTLCCAHGAKLDVALAPKLMNLNSQPTLIKNRVLDRATAYVRDALAAWLEEGAETSYAAQDNDILTTIGFRP